jgi:uncharacterized protein YecE (DUF72 family)
MTSWHLGTIGFSYKDWVGPFYPVGTSPREYLSYYSKIFNAVEINTTFHAIPRQATVKSWTNSTPDGFKFCTKTPRVITHELGLKASQSMMAEFVTSLEPLEEKEGPILIQLPPSFTQDNYDILGEFLESLPENHKYAVEFRSFTWHNQKTVDLLTKYKVCWVSIDFPKIPMEISQTTSFLYIRWIGINAMYHHHTYERVDKSKQLLAWLELIHPYINQVENIYGYFNNDYAGFAAGTAIRCKSIAGLSDSQGDLPFQERFI